MHQIHGKIEILFQIELWESMAWCPTAGCLQTWGLLRRQDPNRTAGMAALFFEIQAPLTV